METLDWQPLLLPAADEAAVLQILLESEGVITRRSNYDYFESLLDDHIIRNINVILTSDHLSVLSHLANGWGAFRFDSRSVTDAIAPFIQQFPFNRPVIYQCHPEGDVHPWQTFAYLCMAGVPLDETVPNWPCSLRELAINSRELNSSEGEELGHLLITSAFLKESGEFSPNLKMSEKDIVLDDALTIACQAHIDGHFGVCRKFHLTEGICALAASERYRAFRPLAELFLKAQLRILEALCAGYLESTSKTRGKTLLLDRLTERLGLGTLLVNHVFYAGHLLELVGVATAFGYAISERSLKAAFLMRSVMSDILRRHLHCLRLPRDIYQLGHFRRGSSMLSVLSHLRSDRRILSKFVLKKERVAKEASSHGDFEQLDFDFTFEPDDTPMSAHLAAVIELWNNSSRRHSIAVGRHAHFRRIHIPGWPRPIHYEFIEEAGEVKTELHFEEAAFSEMAESVYSQCLVSEKRGGTLIRQAGWLGGARIRARNRLNGLDPISSMEKLIDSTRDPISMMLASNVK